MARPDAGDDITALYRLPLPEFTAARNALAKAAGSGGAAIKALSKPPLAAWAVNQLFWRRRPVYDDLIDAATEMRRAHAAVLGGRAADPRASGRRHEEAVEAALKATLDLLREDGHPVTDATRQAVATTLRALPVADAVPGQLDRVLQPGGFEMLAGMTLGVASGGRTAAPAPPRPPAPKRGAAHPGEKAADKTVAAARAAAAEAARELRTAEHAAEREGFRAARAVREAEKAARTLEAAEEAAEEAARAVDAARRDHEAATKAQEEAERAVEQARNRVKAARAAAAKADAAVKSAGRR
jgi:hypothetical protein